MEKKRALSIDALRGYAIITMVLSATIAFGILPQWMYHAQTPPPTHAYDASICGLTWVDLVFPCFLFAMGAAFPFASGRKYHCVIRYIELTFFAIFLQHFYPYMLSNPQDVRAWLLALLAFAILFPMFVRWKKLPKWANICIKLGAYAVAIVMLLTTEHANGVKFDINTSNSIILILANMALFGGGLYALTSDNKKARLLVLPFIMIMLLGDNKEFSPIPAVLKFDYLRYLLIVIPGTFAGEYVKEWMQASNAKQSDSVPEKKEKRMASILAAVCVLGFILNLATINHHRIIWALVVNIAVFLTGRIMVLFIQNEGFRQLWWKLLNMALILTVIGLCFEPLTEGVKKDPATLPYLMVTAGMSIYVLVAFSIICDYLHIEKSTKFLTMTGRNPMIAYVACDLLIYPILNLSGILPLLGVFYLHPVLGFIQGVLLTSLSVLVTMFFTKINCYWRT